MYTQMVRMKCMRENVSKKKITTTNMTRAFGNVYVGIGVCDHGDTNTVLHRIHLHVHSFVRLLYDIDFISYISTGRLKKNCIDHISTHSNVFAKHRAHCQKSTRHAIISLVFKT